MNLIVDKRYGRMEKEIRDLVDMYEHIEKYGELTVEEYSEKFDLSAFESVDPETVLQYESPYTLHEICKQLEVYRSSPEYKRKQEEKEREALRIAMKDLTKLVSDLQDRLFWSYTRLSVQVENLQASIASSQEDRETLLTQLNALDVQVENLQASIATSQEDRETLITQLDALESSLNTRISELANETSNATATNLALHYSSLEKALGKINTTSLGYKIAKLETSNAKIRAELVEVNARLASIRTDARILKHFERIDAFVGVAKWVVFWAVLFVAAIVPILGLKNLMA